jgi:hypothetical protein
MSDQQQMDDFFKEAFNSYSPEVPAGAWERIAATRKKRRVTIVWWRKWLSTKWLIVIAITGLMIAGGLYIDKDKETATAKNLSANNTKGNNQSQGFASNTTASSKKTIDKKAGIFTAENIEAIVNTASKDEMTEAVITADNSSSPTHLKMVKRKTAGKITLSVSMTEVGDGHIDNNAGTNSSVLPTNEANMDAKELQICKMPFNFSAITAFSLADNSHQQIVLNGIRPPGCPPAEKNAAGNKMYWEVYTGADYASKKYTDTGNSVFVEKRKATTSFQSAYSAGIRFTRVFNNGVSFRTGLNYSQINEKFSFIQSNIVQTTYIIDAISGDTTGSFTVRGTRYKTTYNKYRSLDIPLLLGYEVGNGRFHANFNAGAIVNVYSWQQGELLDTNYQPISITTGNGNDAYHYKTNAGIGFTAAASMYYKVNERLHLLAEPYFRYNISPISKDILSLQERFTTIGLRLGIRIDLQ